jgi:pimeloyl-ACP methyl ester carboxylesterase
MEDLSGEGGRGRARAGDGSPGALAEALELIGPPVPRAVGETEVATGRVLGWAEFGHPDGDPVLWFHGTPGARLQVPPTVDEVALQHGFRIIGVERPGSGRSTDHRYRRVADIAADVDVLRAELSLDRFAVVGLSGGGPYALGVAHGLPERVVAVSLLGGFGPTRGRDAVFSITRALRYAAPLFETLRGPVGAGLNRVVPVLEPVADPIFSLYVAVMGFADKPVLNDAAFRAMFLHDLLNAGEFRSVAHDLALFSRHWGFHLTDVRAPVIVWQGLSDTIVPPSHGHHQAARLPRAELHVRPGEGHFAGFSDVVSVLDRLREVWAAETAEPLATNR